MTINIQTYGAKPCPDIDTTPIVREALLDLADGPERRMVFPKGRYHFWPDRAGEEYLFISNNDEFLKRIAFDMRDLSDIEIDGQGSEFVFHGFISPFVLRNCRDVCLRNFTMDWERTFHSEAEIVAYSDRPSQTSIADLRISPAFPYRIEHNQVLFEQEGTTVEALRWILEFDPDRRETAYRAVDNGVVGQYSATQLDADTVRIEGIFKHPLSGGNILSMSTGMRYCQGIALLDCNNVGISDVTIHHCGGMGVIAQRTRDVNLQRVRVTPNVAVGRIISATADAVHFVNCAGHIRIDECLFENQLDDPVNIHGIYARVSRILQDRCIEVELVHPQQRGIDITQPGDTVEFVANENLFTYHVGTVESFKRLNKQFYHVVLNESLPARLKAGDGMASLGWIPDVTITNTVARNNRARGFLLSTAGKVRIENNHFHTPNSPILIAGDANYWFESGKVRDVVIRGNHFDDCLYGAWGGAAITIAPEIETSNRTGPAYHKNIRIERNRFTGRDSRLLCAHSVDGLTFKDNIIDTLDNVDAIAVDMHSCKNVVVEM